MACQRARVGREPGRQPHREPEEPVLPLEEVGHVRLDLGTGAARGHRHPDGLPARRPRGINHADRWLLVLAADDVVRCVLEPSEPLRRHVRRPEQLRGGPGRRRRRGRARPLRRDDRHHRRHHRRPHRRRGGCGRRGGGSRGRRRAWGGRGGRDGGRCRRRRGRAGDRGGQPQPEDRRADQPRPAEEAEADLHLVGGLGQHGRRPGGGAGGDPVAPGPVGADSADIDPDGGARREVRSEVGGHRVGRCRRSPRRQHEHAGGASGRRRGVDEAHRPVDQCDVLVVAAGDRELRAPRLPRREGEGDRGETERDHQGDRAAEQHATHTRSSEEGISRPRHEEPPPGLRGRTWWGRSATTGCSCPGCRSGSRRSPST